MKVLVTGGAGFIGSHLIESLIKLDYEVISLDNYSTGRKENEHKGCLYVPYDLTELGSWSRGHEVDIIFHLAALPRIQYSIKYPGTILFNNYQATLSVLEYARLNDIRLVYAASSSYYGNPLNSPYALSKWQGEHLCDLYSSVYEVAITKARFFNVYGPRQIEEGDFATVIGIFEKCSREGLPFPVVGDGTQSRDFTHVYDTVRALISLLKFNIQFNGTYEIGTSKSYSILDIVKMFNSNVKFVEERPGEYNSSLANPKRAKEELGWKAEIDLPDYIKEL